MVPSVMEPGLTVTPIPEATVTVALAETVVSACAVAVTVTVGGLGTNCGAVYRPVLSTVPTVALPLAVLVVAAVQLELPPVDGTTTHQLTLVLLDPATVAENCCWLRMRTVALRLTERDRDGGMRAAAQRDRQARERKCEPEIPRLHSHSSKFVREPFQSVSHSTLSTGERIALERPADRQPQNFHRIKELRQLGVSLKRLDLRQNLRIVNSRRQAGPQIFQEAVIELRLRGGDRQRLPIPVVRPIEANRRIDDGEIRHEFDSRRRPQFEVCVAGDGQPAVVIRQSEAVHLNLLKAGGTQR